MERNRRILDMRDLYIAERIGQTLKQGETGLIFLGMLHSLKGRLPDDIRVTQLCAGDAHSALGSHGTLTQGMVLS